MQCKQQFSWALTLRGLNKLKTQCEVREKTNKMQQLDVYYQYQ